MINLLIISHSTLGAAYAKLARHIFPENSFPRIHVLNVEDCDDHACIIAQAQQILAQIHEGSGTLVMTDIFGATPCNAALKLLVPHRIALITGLNAPMLVKAITHSKQSENLDEFVETVKQAGISGIIAFTESPD